MMKASSFLETVMLNFFHMLLLSKSIQVASAKQAMLNVLKVVNAKKRNGHSEFYGITYFLFGFLLLIQVVFKAAVCNCFYFFFLYLLKLSL